MNKFLLALLALFVPAMATAQTSNMRLTGRDPTGLDRPVNVSADGRLLVSGDTPLQAGVPQRSITKTSLAANTSTSVCPVPVTPIVTEVQVQTGGVGLGFQGQTLTTAGFAVGAAAPDLVMSSAGALYTFPVAPTNAVTAYSATAQVVICIQTMK